jgi:hypothetical protein
MAIARNRRRPARFREMPVEVAHVRDRRRTATECQRQCCRRRVDDAQQDQGYRFASDEDDEVDMREVTIVSDKLQRLLLHDLEHC